MSFHAAPVRMESKRSRPTIKVGKSERGPLGKNAGRAREKGLKAAGRAGRLPRLNEAQNKVVVNRLLEGPERLGYETPLSRETVNRWTTR
jgi:hypothetical protein